MRLHSLAVGFRCQGPNLIIVVGLKWLRWHLPLSTLSFFHPLLHIPGVIVLIFSDQTQEPPWGRPRFWWPPS